MNNSLTHKQTNERVSEGEREREIERAKVPGNDRIDREIVGTT